MKKTKIFSYIIIGIYIIILLIISRNLQAPYLWFDEAGQFFISKGLNHDSNPMEIEKGLVAVIENNAHYNLDPGGFSILLHYWSKISNNQVWLRTLPFIFFIFIILAFIYLSYSWTKNINISLLMGFIPIISPIITNMGFEVRAFSMECLGTIIGVIALDRLNKKILLKELLLWGLVFSFFMTSRYSEIIVTFVVSLIIFYLILKSKMNLKNKINSILVYISPIVITLTGIYFSALKIQNPNADPVTYLPYLSSNKMLLLKPINFMYLLFIAFIFALILLKNLFPSINKFKMLLVLTVSLNFIFIILSLLGKHPWAPFSNKLISIFVILLLCFNAIFGEILIPIFTKNGNIKYFIIIFAVLLTIYIRKDKLSIRLLNTNNTFYCIEKIDFNKINSIYVDRWESPCIRYLYEYGKLKEMKEGIYPQKYTFAKSLKHNFYSNKMSLKDFYATQPKMNDLLGYDLLITPELFKQASNDRWKLLDGCLNIFVKKY